MLATAVDSLRLFLHILAATVWVGGQLTLAALVPVLRARDPELPKLAARAFDKIAWPAYGEFPSASYSARAAQNLRCTVCFGR